LASGIGPGWTLQFSKLHCSGFPADLAVVAFDFQVVQGME
jgi:hypothetical protein